MSDQHTPGPEIDDWRSVMNGPGTYAALASDLRSRGAVVIGWTDGEGSHLDILFTLAPRQYGSLQGGLRGGSDLFVSVMRRAAFGFELASPGPRHPDYIAEKLGYSSQSVTAERVADLINGVIGELDQPMLLSPVRAAIAKATGGSP